MSRLNLHTTIDIKSGFCFGATKAIEKAEASLKQDNELYSLGEIVHNDEEISRLESKGLRTINSENLKTIKNKTIIFRAHGEPPASYKTAKSNSNQIIDASCPIILELQQQVKKSFENNEKIYIYGKEKHPEIIGINGQINNKAVIFDNINNLDIESMPKKITLFSQTTQSLKSFNEITCQLLEKGIDVDIKDTICRQVANREKRIIEFSQHFDKIIFIAGKNSSNGKNLYDNCKKHKEGTFFISSTNEIKKEWFEKNDCVGICGATSTPSWQMKEVEEYLQKL